MSASTIEAPVEVPTVEGVKVGDFFSSSWGYDQTNIDFYKVVEVSKSGATVKVQEWSQTTSPAGQGSDRVAPGAGPRTYPRWVDGHRDGETTAAVMTKRVNRRCGEPMLTMTTYSVAYLWEGDSKHQTASGWGH